MKSEPIYETTPYGVKQQSDGRWAVEQAWWGRTISTHATEDKARAACREEARRNGCLRRVP